MSVQKLLIFGATSAIATEVARIWAKRGGSVFCVGRNPEKLSTLIDDLKVRAAGAGGWVGSRPADLNEFEGHAGLWGHADQEMGGVDAVLVAHGTLPNQAACQDSVETMLAEFNTNALSAMSLLTLAANRMEARGGGLIVAISSVAGDRGRKSNYVYGAAKGALTLFMQGLRNRLAGSGVTVVTIKPGFVDTPMTDGFEKGGPLWSSPALVAEGIVRAMDKRLSVVYLPWFWRYIMLIIRYIPENIFKRMSL